MQTKVEDAIKIIENLPIEDYDRIRKVLDEKERANKPENCNKENIKDEIARFKKSQKWIGENREKYLNQWVCLQGDKLIAHGEDALEVDRTAKEAGIEAPFLEHIVEEKYPFGGW